MNRLIASVFVLVICLNITSDLLALDSNGNIIINNGGGMAISIDSNVNTGIDLGENGNKNIIKGNNEIKSVTRNIDKFKSIQISGAFDIVVRKGDRSNVKITGDSNLLPHVKTEIASESLSITTDSSLSCKNKIKVDICMSGEISKLELSGACMLVFKGITAKTFLVKLDGTSSAVLAGNVDVFDVVVAGVCTLKAEELKTRITSVSVSGTGKADVFASEKLKASILGVGTVNYYGNPKDIVKNISLLGQLNRK